MPNAEQLVSDIQRAMAGGDPARDLKERRKAAMTPITGPATLLRRVAKILTTARRARRPLRVPTTIDGDRLFAYGENTLDADERRAVEDQARTCDECRLWLEEIGKLFGERGVSTSWISDGLTTESQGAQRKNTG